MTLRTSSRSAPDAGETETQLRAIAAIKRIVLSSMLRIARLPSWTAHKGGFWRTSMASGMLADKWAVGDGQHAGCARELASINDNNGTLLHGLSGNPCGGVEQCGTRVFRGKSAPEGG